MRLVVILSMLAISSPSAHAALTIADLLPVKGDRGVYSISEDTTMAFEGSPVRMSSKGVGTQTAVIAAVSKGSLATVFIVLSTQTMKRTGTPSGHEDTTESYTMEVGRATPTGLYLDSNFQIEGDEDDSVDIGRTLLEIKLPCTPGTTWSVGRMAFKDGYALRPVSKATIYETVEVPAGKFENCLRVESDCPNGVEGYVMQEDQKLEIISSTTHYTTWYYPRIGVVKELAYSALRLRPEGQENAAILSMITRATTELKDYHLAPRANGG